MKRKEWLFTYTSGVLAAAATEKQARHATKLAWWENKKQETMKKIGESGISVQDSVAAAYSNTKGGYGPEITIDATLQRDLTECQGKIMEHHKLVESYNAWTQVLEANKDDRLELDHEDYMFFFEK